MFTVTEGDPGYNTSVLVIVDIMDGQPDIALNFTISSTATSMSHLSYIDARYTEPKK